MPNFILQLEHDLVVSTEVKPWNINRNKYDHKRKSIYIYIYIYIYVHKTYPNLII
jgi:hypothetical protein